MDLFSKLGIDWKLLLAQFVNFGIVLLVLWRFVYRPLSRYLDARRERIEQSLKEAQRIEAELKAMEVKKAESAREARAEAQAILKQAEVEAERQRQETLTRVRAEAEKVVADARAKFSAEQDEAMQAMRREAARLVVSAVTKVIGKIPGAELDKKLAEEAVAEVAKRKS